METLARILLFGGNVKFLLIFITFGIGCCFNKWFGDRIYESLLLLLFTMIFVYFLKSLWKIPLHPSLGNGWAFPSSHMQMGVVFWGYLSWVVNRRFFFCLSGIILIGLGSALSYFNYHVPEDIIAALGFGIVTVWLYILMLKLKFFDCVPKIGLVLTVLGLPFVWFLYVKCQARHLVLAESMLIAITIGYWLFSKYSINISGINSWFFKIVFSACIAIIGFWLYRIFPVGNIYIYSLKFLLIGFLISTLEIPCSINPDFSQNRLKNE